MNPATTDPLLLAECIHRESDVAAPSKLYCRLASRFAELPIAQCSVGADACRFCMTRAVAPDTPNEVVASMAVMAVRSHAPDRLASFMEQMKPYVHHVKGQSERRKTAADLPCIHRGDLLRHVTCEMCGSKGLQIEVHQCKLPKVQNESGEIIECVPVLWSEDPTKQPNRRCLTCHDRAEPVQIQFLGQGEGDTSRGINSTTLSLTVPSIRIIHEPHPRLTVGMATYDDFDGVYFTVQSLRLYHQDAFPLIPPSGGVPKDWPVEIVVVDNNPDSSDGQMTRDFLTSWVPEARYVPFTAAKGTAAPRNQVFAEARGDVVVCVDPHVLIHQGALSRLLAYSDSTRNHRDLWQGPMVYDNGVGLATHFDIHWRAEMFGIWGDDPRATDVDLPPFEIPMQGLGLFACRRTEWLGFNPAFRGFGAEEGYIQEKYRLAGHRAMCLPFLRWTHRFGRPSGVPYSIARPDKLRNYVIGWSELGLPLDSIHEHFVTSGLTSEDDWKQCVAEANAMKPEAVRAGRPFLINALSRKKAG